MTVMVLGTAAVSLAVAIAALATGRYPAAAAIVVIASALIVYGRALTRKE